MSTIFTKIIKREIPAHIIAEDDLYIAFLDVAPLAKGHALVVPKQEVDYLFDLNDETLSGLFSFAKKVALAINSVVPCERVGVSVIGLEVPHAHVHLIPINKVSDMNFARPKLSLNMEELNTIAKNIREVIQQ